jgi:hypothetical protein
VIQAARHAPPCIARVHQSIEKAHDPCGEEYGHIKRDARGPTSRTAQVGDREDQRDAAEDQAADDEPGREVAPLDLVRGRVLRVTECSAKEQGNRAGQHYGVKRVDRSRVPALDGDGHDGSLLTYMKQIAAWSLYAHRFPTFLRSHLHYIGKRGIVRDDVRATELLHEKIGDRQALPCGVPGQIRQSSVPTRFDHDAWSRDLSVGVPIGHFTLHPTGLLH